MLTSLADVQQILWSIIDITLTLPFMQPLSVRSTHPQGGRPVRAERPYVLARLQVEPDERGSLATDKYMGGVLWEMKRGEVDPGTRPGGKTECSGYNWRLTGLTAPPASGGVSACLAHVHSRPRRSCRARITAHHEGR